MQRVTFNSGMAAIARFFPEKSIDLEIAWEYLKDMTDDQFMNAINIIMKDEKDINKASNIIAIIRHAGLKPLMLEAGEAWAVVLKAVSKIGSYGQPKFKDEAIGKAVECIGWRNICLSETIGVERAHFMKIYETLKTRKEKESVIGDSGIKQLTSDVVKQIGNRR